MPYYVEYTQDGNEIHIEKPTRGRLRKGYIESKTEQGRFEPKAKPSVKPVDPIQCTKIITATKRCSFAEFKKFIHPLSTITRSDGTYSFLGCDVIGMISDHVDYLRHNMVLARIDATPEGNIHIWYDMGQGNPDVIIQGSIQKDILIGS